MNNTSLFFKDEMTRWEILLCHFSAFLSLLKSELWRPLLFAVHIKTWLYRRENRLLYAFIQLKLTWHKAIYLDQLMIRELITCGNYYAAKKEWKVFIFLSKQIICMHVNFMQLYTIY